MMSSNARIFFAGVGTTFVILAVGFGADLMMASSTLPDTARRAGSTSERLAPVRVVLPASAEPARRSGAAAGARVEASHQVEAVGFPDALEHVELRPAVVVVDVRVVVTGGVHPGPHADGHAVRRPAGRPDTGDSEFSDSHE